MPPKGQHLLSICLITKNEERKLAPCLQSVQAIADEIIIVDTGSTDNTIKIAKQFGAKIYRKKWNNDFSFARNHAIAKASGKWILFLDADESISQDEVTKLKPLLDNPMAEGYLFYIETHLVNHEAPSRIQALRLFRNREEYRFQNRVYERIPEELITSTKDSGITIYHEPDFDRYLYMQQLKRDLLQEEIKVHPTDSYLHYVYGIELLNKEDFEQGAKQFQEAIKFIDYYHLYSHHLYKLLAYSLFSMQKYAEVIETASEGLHYYPFYTDLVYLRGKAYKELEQYQQAIQDFERAIKLGDAPSHLVSEIGIGSYKAVYLLGQVQEELLNFEQAIQYYKQAYQIERNFTEPLYRIGAIVKQNPQLGRIDEILFKLLNSTSQEEIMTLIDILCLEREYELALNYLKLLTNQKEMEEEIVFVKGICYMLMGLKEQAEENFLSIREEHPYYSQVLLRRIQNYWFHQEWEKASQLLKLVNGSKKIKEQTLKTYQLVHTMLAGNKAIEINFTEMNIQALAKLIEYLLLMNQDIRNNGLLELLIQAKQEQQWVRIGELLAEKRDSENAFKIYRQIENKHLQKVYREKVAKQFLDKNDLNSAEKLLQSEKANDYGVLGYYLQYKIWLQKTLQLIDDGLKNRKINKATKSELTRLKELISNEN